MAEAVRIDGKAAAAELRASVGSCVADLKARHGVTPGLAVVLAGDDPASQVYVRMKKRTCGELGIASFDHDLPINCSEKRLLQLIATLNAAPCRSSHARSLSRVAALTTRRNHSSARK